MSTLQTISTSVRITMLKREARGHLQAYRHSLEGLDCGMELAKRMRPQIETHRLRFNATMDELAKIDPDTPTSRL